MTSQNTSSQLLQILGQESTRKKISPANLALIDNNNYQYPEHLQLLNHKLLDVANGKIKRLMVFMPPRHAKSETISKYFSAWFIGQYPDKRIILTSYEADFAATWGYKARTVLEEHQTDFNIEIDEHSKARNRWNTTKNGGMVTAGVGGPITGKGADILIIDDPVKNAEEAQSETYREKAWDWFLSTSYTRLEPDAAIILIMTRWHEDDLAGRILERSNEKWEVIKLPALAETNDPLNRKPEEALWPERYNTIRLKEIQKEIGTYWFSALYQQSPLPPEGGIFQRSWFKTRITPPNPIKMIRMWDTAATPPSKAKDPDYTVGLLLYQYNDGTYQIEDIYHKQITPLTQEKDIYAIANQDGRSVRIRMFRGVGDTGIHQISTYTRLLAGYDFREVKEDKSKDSPQRIGPVAAQAEAGNIYLKHDASWINSFLDEISTFPFGKHDDQTDALSGAFNELFNDKRQTWTVMG